MVTTDLEEKQNKKFYVPIRGGNRGGWDQFKWQNVMYMPYKVRELYLGNSAMIGFLDKGGKWRKKNWYLKTEKDFKASDVKQQMLEAKKRDEERFKAALGQDAFEQFEEKLNEAELEELKRKLKNNDEYQKIPGAQGLGFDKLKVQIKSRPGIDNSNPYRLQGIAQIPNEDGEAKQKKKKERTSSEKRRRKQKKEKKREQRRQEQEIQKRSRSRSHSDRRQRSRSRRKKLKTKEFSRKRRDSRQRDFSRSISMERQNRARERSIQQKKKYEKRRRSPSSVSRQRQRKRDRRHRRSRSRS